MRGSAPSGHFGEGLLQKPARPLDALRHRVPSQRLRAAPTRGKLPLAEIFAFRKNRSFARHSSSTEPEVTRNQGSGLNVGR